jgi:ABC-type antimicrobial peptide transport system permease subunit
MQVRAFLAAYRRPEDNAGLSANVRCASRVRAAFAEGRQYLLLAWWMTTLPGLALLVVGVALSLIGDGLAERRGG